MRRLSILVTSLIINFAMALSGIAFSPAHASALPDGNYLCSSGVITTTMSPTYTITADVVSSGSGCIGAVVIPQGVTSIGFAAFAYADSLSSIAIPDDVTSIDMYAFFGATSLTDITFGPNSKLISIGIWAFYGANSLASITIPAGVTGIRGGAFWAASSLSSIYFLGNAPTVDSSSFSNIKTSAKAYFRTGATGFAPDINGQWNGVPISPFYKLTFEGTDSESGSVPSQIFSGAGESITIPGNTGGLTKTGYDFAGWSQGIDHGGTGQRYSAGDVGPMPAFDGTLYVTWTASPPIVVVDGTYLCSTGKPTSESTNIYTITTVGNDVTVSDGGACTGAVVIPEGVTSIGHFAFESLTAITIPASVVSIGDYAFMHSSVTSLTFLGSSQLTSIGEYAFYAATSLIAITIPASVTSIGHGAFWAATSLNSITFGANSRLTSIGQAAFMDVASLIAITIPASVTSIGAEAFLSSHLSSVYFLGDAPTVGPSAFYYVGNAPRAYIKIGNTTFTPALNGTWNGLTVTFFEYVVNYDSNGGSPVGTDGFINGGTVSAPTVPTRDGYGFAGWSRTDGGVAVVFPYVPGGASDVTLFAKWLVDGAYECTTGLSTTPQLPPPSAINTYPITDGVVVTNGSANGSNNCAGAVVIPEGVTSIGDNAFGYANFPTSITISASVTTIGNYAFYGATSLEDVTFAADSRLTAINNFAFQYATSLALITIPASVTSMGFGAFMGASKLSNIYFLGNAPTVGEGAFTDIGEAPKAYVKNANVSSFTPLVDGKWNGLTVVIVDPPVVDPPVVPPSVITPDTAADLAAAKLAAGKLAAADLAARTVGKKKTFVAKTLAKRVGIKTVSSKATVTMSVSKSSKKICAVSESKLMTLKVGKCLVTFTVQEPKPKKGKLPKAKRTTKTLVVN